uniref:Ig-like domain-containing protein n=1 Tax=Anabas testudineus TaxID=64144 RepID=A0A7N6F8B3_ANATE
MDLSAVMWFILLTGQSQLICSSESVAAQAGEDVILPCRLYPPIRASSRTVEWTRPGLDPEYIHVHQDGRLVYQSQNPLYSYRTTLFVDQLVNGNVSLKIFNVKMSDGTYKCLVPQLDAKSFIDLAISKRPITVRGPDDLYTVSSRLTVEKIDNITCRVQQSNINQTRETHIYVTGSVFPIFLYYHCFIFKTFRSSLYKPCECSVFCDFR